MSEIAIRTETVDDHAAIRRVVAAAFPTEAEGDLVERLRASSDHRPDWSIVAEDDGEVVGHVMVSWATIVGAQADRPAALLAPLAVTPDRQGQGIGAALVRAAADAVLRAGETFVLLEGDPRYYGRFGFEPAARFGVRMPLPDWAPADAAQLLPLDGFDSADPTLRGAVRYAEAFDELPE